MGAGKRQQAIRAMRGQMWSPGRPSVARREDRQRFWREIAAGCSSEDAAAAAGVSQAVGSRWFRDGGGMPPISLAPLSGRYLSFAEREEIALLHAQRVGVRGIARRLGRSPSTISRELRRNASTRSHSIAYRATTAQWHAERRASRPKVSKLAANDALRTYVQDRLAGAIARPDGSPAAGPEVRWVGRRRGRRTDRRWASSWSPEQIANRLRVDFPDDPFMRISHEAIYQSLYVQGRGALRRERHPGRADDPVSDAASPAPHERARRRATCQERAGAGRARRRGCPRRDCRLDPDAARPAAQVADLGSGRGDGRARAATHRRRLRHLLLRSAQPLAARQQRKHQRPAPPILPQRDRPQPTQRRRARRRRARTQHPPTQDPRLAHPRRSPQRPPAGQRGLTARRPTPADTTSRRRRGVAAVGNRSGGYAASAIADATSTLVTSIKHH